MPIAPAPRGPPTPSDLPAFAIPPGLCFGRLPSGQLFARPPSNRPCRRPKPNHYYPSAAGRTPRAPRNGPGPRTQVDRLADRPPFDTATMAGGPLAGWSTLATRRGGGENLPSSNSSAVPPPARIVIAARPSSPWRRTRPCAGRGVRRASLATKRSTSPPCVPAAAFPLPFHLLSSV